MEVRLVSTNGVKEDAILSIRAGAIKRQAPISSGRPFRFPKLSVEDSPLRVAILQQIGTAYLVLKPSDGLYQVSFDSGATCEVDVRKAAGGEEEGRAPHADAKPTAANATEAKDYLEKHQVLQFVQAVLQAVIKERPADPYAYMARHFTSGYSAGDGGACKSQAAVTPRAEAGAMPEAAPLPSAATGARVAVPPPQEAPKPSAEAARGDAGVTEALRAKLYDTMVQASQEGTLANALEAVIAKDGGFEPGKSEELRLQVQGTLLQASESGALASALRGMRQRQAQGEPEGRSLEDIQGRTWNVLIQASDNGRLASALKEVERQHAEALCARTQQVLLRASGDGSLDNIIQSVIRDVQHDDRGGSHCPGQACQQAIDALVRAAEDGTLPHTIRAMTPSSPEPTEALRERARSALARAAESGALAGAISGQAVESTCQRTKSALLQASLDGSLDSLVRSLNQNRPEAVP